MPRTGERYDDSAGHVMEWTGTVWTPVCPTDQIPLDARDGQGWLICRVCRHRVKSLVR